MTRRFRLVNRADLNDFDIKLADCNSRLLAALLAAQLGDAAELAA